MRRRKPFSGKQKRQQLQEKRQAQARRATGESEGDAAGSAAIRDRSGEAAQDSVPRKDGTRCFLRFINDSNETVATLRALGHDPFSDTPLFKVDQGVYLAANCCPDLPRRPAGVQQMTHEELREAEAETFDRYFRGISPDLQTISREYCAFEINEEVYREVWRVSERSDVLCVVTDSRFPLAHAPISILRYAWFEKRPIILVLNKSDLVPPEALEAWTRFMEQYLERVFALCEGESRSSVPGGVSEASGGAPESRPNSTKHFAVMAACARHLEKCAVDRLQFVSTLVETARALSGIAAPQRVTVGFYGQPSVGKSSLMNGIYGRKIVSVKRTPGHTKHLQTYYLDPLALREKADAEVERGKADPTLSSRQARIESMYLLHALSPGEEAEKDEKDEVESGESEDSGEIYTNDDEDEEASKSPEKPREVRGSQEDEAEETAPRRLDHSTTQSEVTHTESSPLSPDQPSVPLQSETHRSFLLCDCPGLVFPVRWSPRPLQVITGVFPLGRTREFVSPLRLLCENVPGLRQRLVDELEKANLPARFPGAAGKCGNSPLEILELFGYYWGFEAKSGPDIQRAGISLFKRIVDGRVGYYFMPDPSILPLVGKDLGERPSYWTEPGKTPADDTVVSTAAGDRLPQEDDGEPRCGWW